MTRRTWIAVLSTLAVLAAASGASRLDVRALAAASAPAALAALAVLRAGGAASGGALAALARAAGEPAALLLEAKLAVGLALALLVGLCVLAASHAPRRSRGDVLRQARAGRAHARIARRTGLARDAVRLALSPALRQRRAAPARSAGRQDPPRHDGPADGAGRALNATR